MEKEYLDLFTLQALLKEGVETLFPDRIWVKAEIAEINRKPNGHCYLELSQSGRNGLVAKARAVIWASRFPSVDQFFRSVTGSSLGKGMEVLCHVQISYHVLYGMTMTIDDIDPSFTIGEKEVRRQETLDRLSREGLLNLQKRLRLPPLPYRLAVISAEGAAGYGDFRRHLLENEYGFAYDVRLFPATMQGEEAAASMVAAFREILSSEEEYDAVLLMRGGGSELDLACFDDYELAVAIARCPVPVFTAIGHDKDFHVADQVANTFVKTPTALADLFLECSIEEDQRLGALESRLMRLFTGRIASMESALDLRNSHVRLSALRRLDAAASALDLFQTRIAATDPRAILRKGYVLALDKDGIKMTSATGGRVGDPVRMMFADGTLRCTVGEVEMKENI